MTAFIQSDYLEPVASKVFSDPYESVLMECERVIHAAVISKRFLESLLSNPIKTIEKGYCGEKFTFTQEEKQQIRLIQATSLAEFSNHLIQAVKQVYSIATTHEMAYAQLEPNHDRTI